MLLFGKHLQTGCPGSIGPRGLPYLSPARHRRHCLEVTGSAHVTTSEICGPSSKIAYYHVPLDSSGSGPPSGIVPPRSSALCPKSRGFPADSPCRRRGPHKTADQLAEHGEQPTQTSHRQNHGPRRMPISATANPIPCIAKFQKNIDNGFLRLTFSFSVRWVFTLRR